MFPAPAQRSVTRRLLRAWTDNCHGNPIEGRRRSLSRASLKLPLGARDCFDFSSGLWAGQGRAGQQVELPEWPFSFGIGKTKWLPGWALTGTPVKMTAVNVARPPRFRFLLPD